MTVLPAGGHRSGPHALALAGHCSSRERSSATLTLATGS